MPDVKTGLIRFTGLKLPEMNPAKSRSSCLSRLPADFHLKKEKTRTVKTARAFLNSGSLTGSVASQRQRDTGLIGAIAAAGELEADLVRAISQRRADAIGAGAAGEVQTHAIRATAVSEVAADLVRATAAGQRGADTIRAAAEGEGGLFIRLGRLHGHDRNEREEGNRGNNHFLHSADIFHPFGLNVNGRPAARRGLPPS
jgi:hypothetical protein